MEHIKSHDAIRKLTAENARLRRQVERLGWLVEHAARGAYSSAREHAAENPKYDFYIHWNTSTDKKQLDAILADEPGETE